MVLCCVVFPRRTTVIHWTGEKWPSRYWAGVPGLRSIPRILFLWEDCLTLPWSGLRPEYIIDPPLAFLPTLWVLLGWAKDPLLIFHAFFAPLQSLLSPVAFGFGNCYWPGQDKVWGCRSNIGNSPMEGMNQFLLMSMKMMLLMPQMACLPGILTRCSGKGPPP